MSKIWKRYADWSVRQASKGQCSPALVLLGVGLVLAIVAWVYRRVIIDTVEVCVACLLGLVAAYVGYRILRVAIRAIKRTRQRSAVRAQAEVVSPSPAEMGTLPTPVLSDHAAISKDMLKLADPDTQLFGIDEGDVQVIRMKPDKKASKS